MVELIDVELFDVCDFMLPRRGENALSFCEQYSEVGRWVQPEAMLPASADIAVPGTPGRAVLS